MEEVILQAESAGSLQQYEEVVDASDDLHDVYGVSHMDSDIYIQDDLPPSNHHHHHHHSSVGGLHLALPDSQTLSAAVSTTTTTGNSGSGGKRRGTNSLVRLLFFDNYNFNSPCTTAIECNLLTFLLVFAG